MILLLGGTSDSVLLAQKLYEAKKPVLLSTATEYGERIARERYQGEIVNGKMDGEKLKYFCQKRQIYCIVDATHPYARLVSENAIVVSQALNLSYYRYERPASEALLALGEKTEGIVFFDSYEAAGKWVNEKEGNILITTGSKDIEKLIRPIEDLKRIFLRLLPVSEQLIKMENLGFLPKQLMAMQGPFSVAMNKAMIETIQAKYLITKESGAPGKTDEKIEAARSCGVCVLVIRRPNIIYPNVFESMETVLEQLEN